jgi:hypothetical protein
VIAAESNLAKAWESVITYCGTIECTVVSSNLVAQRRDAAPSGSMSLRVAPGDLKKLFDQVEKLGQIAGHATDSEDKTTTVLDTEARIKNLTSFRDSLRAMLAKPSASIKDIIDIQQQLTEAQSQLDSETAQRKILANETEKVAVEITFGVERSGRNRSAWTPIGDALRESGADLAVSTAWLISAIVTIIPWIVLIVPLLLAPAQTLATNEAEGKQHAILTSGAGPHPSLQSSGPRDHNRRTRAPTCTSPA